ncbi:recombinase family protein [Rhodococcus sp. 11-3]|uniref:recombinase family protein n=1 Tax=Rhodococcus sp. 11-3 TaxID=2854796 RepID=UPI00218B5FA3|nr:recombinase family protein [Rhodococcus sp. 11-3]USC16970.1 recombinase family protein [Rhodococcus sp. 11-3]
MTDRQAVIYARVSADTTGKARSVTEQEAECRELCESEGWPVRSVVVDNNISASQWGGKERPGYKQLLTTLRPGDILVCWEPSRITRQPRELEDVIDLCVDRGVILGYVSGEIYDPSKARDRRAMRQDSVDSAYEADKARDRILRAHRANLKARKAHGKIPFGYRAERDPDTGEVLARVPHPTEAPVVQEAFLRVLAGEPLYTIAQDFNRRQVPSYGASVKWTQTSLGYLLRRATYAGLRTHKGEIVGPGTNWEPLIDEADWRKVQAILSNPSRRTQRGNAPSRLLSGIAVCGVCGAGVERIKGYKGRDMYSCSAPQRHVQRPQQAVDELAVEYMLSILSDPRMVARLSAAEDEGDHELADALETARALRQRLEEHYAEAAEGIISGRALGAIESRLQPQIDAAEARANSYMVDPVLAQVAGPDARQRWEALSFAQQREVLRAALSVVIRPAGRGRRNYDVAETVDISWRE